MKRVTTPTEATPGGTACRASSKQSTVAKVLGAGGDVRLQPRCCITGVQPKSSGLRDPRRIGAIRQIPSREFERHRARFVFCRIRLPQGVWTSDPPKCPGRKL